jgi:hypothetical protein
MTMTSTSDDAIRAFRLDVADAALADLHDRLDRSRWTADWSRSAGARVPTNSSATSTASSADCGEHGGMGWRKDS